MNSFQLFKKRKNCENSTKILRSIWYPFRKFEFHNGTFCSQIDRCLRSSTEYLQDVHNSPPNRIPLKTWSTIFIWKNILLSFILLNAMWHFHEKIPSFNDARCNIFIYLSFIFLKKKRKLRETAFHVTSLLQNMRFMLGEMT